MQIVEHHTKIPTQREIPQALERLINDGHCLMRIEREVIDIERVGQQQTTRLTWYTIHTVTSRLEPGERYVPLPPGADLRATSA